VEVEVKVEVEAKAKVKIQLHLAIKFFELLNVILTAAVAALAAVNSASQGKSWDWIAVI
jgi:hypothetical protein